MQPNIFNWMKMSKSHRHFSERAYPVSADVARHSRNYPQFVQNVQSLSGLQLDKYTQEWNQWNNEKGKAWGARGGIQENSMSTPGIIQRKGIMSVGAMSMGATPGMPADADAMADNGWNACNKAPTGATKKNGPTTYPNDPTWNYTTYADATMPAVTYILMSRKSNSDKFWWFSPGIPCGGTVGTVTSDKTYYIKKMQKALNEYYLAGSGTALVVDGIKGPKTCSAAYGFNVEFVGDTSNKLSGAFFEGLYLPAEYASFLDSICTPWYDGVTTTPIVDEVIELDPEPKKAGMGIIVGVILLGTAIGAWAFGGKKGKRK